MEIIYLYGIIQIIFLVWLMLGKEDDKHIDKNNHLEKINWIAQNPAPFIFFILNWIWCLMGLFTDLWTLFVFLIISKITYSRIYDYTTYRNHAKIRYAHIIAEIILSIIIVYKYFY